MSSRSGAAPAPPSSQTLSPLVVCYSYRYAAPLNLTPWMSSGQTTATLAGSTRDTASVAFVGSQVAQIVTIGDWVQIDLRDRDGGREHLFFGRVSSIDPAANVIGGSGGIEISTTISVTTWAAVFEVFQKDVRTFFQVRSADVVANPGSADLPMLAKIAAALGVAGFVAPPYVHVQTLLQMMARYGGTLRQTFDLPASFSATGAPITLLDIVAKCTRPRLDASTRPLVPTPAGSGAAGNYVVDADAVNVAVAADRSNPATASWLNSAWLLCDWATQFAAHPYYPLANATLDEVLQLASTAPLWAAACEYADLPWCQLHCCLVEHISWRGSAAILTAHDGTEFHRDFLLSISFAPIPHPVYRAGSTPLRTEDGDAVVPADSTGYSARPKVIVDTRYVSSLPMTRNDDGIHTVWQVTPLDASFRAMATYDAAWLGHVSGGRLPIFDMPGIAVYGFKPAETQTKYWFDATAKEFWPTLARKTALQYAWTIHGPDLLTGGASWPAFTANVPRPADVVLLVNEVAGTGGVVGLDRDPGFRPGPLDAALHGKPGHNRSALSVYAEAVSVHLASESGAWQGVVQVSYSHGQPILVGGSPALNGRPYWRGMAWREIGIDPKYWLPDSPVPALLEAAAVPPTDTSLPARIDKAMAAIKPATRVRRAVRHATRPAPAVPVGAGMSGMSEEPPTEITEADLIAEPETGPKPSRKRAKPVPLPAPPMRTDIGGAPGRRY